MHISLTCKGDLHNIPSGIMRIFLLIIFMEEKMRIKKVISITVICLALPILALAQGGAPQGQAPAGAQGGAPGGAPGATGGNSTVDMSLAFTQMDKDKDGKVTKAEFLATGMTQSMYDNLFVNMLDKNKDGVMTKDELGVPMFDVDTNKDGKCSLEEFVVANKNAEAQRSAGGQSGQQSGAPGGAPAGAAPSK
jgi:hypothetical protein